MDLSYLDGFALSYCHTEDEADRIARAVLRALNAVMIDRSIRCRVQRDTETSGYFVELHLESE